MTTYYKYKEYYYLIIEGTKTRAGEMAQFASGYYYEWGPGTEIFKARLNEVKKYGVIASDGWQIFQELFKSIKSKAPEEFNEMENVA